MTYPPVWYLVRLGRSFVYSALVLQECASNSFTLPSFSSCPSVTLQLDAERSCHRLWRWLKRAALRSKRKSKQRYKMFLDASTSSPPSKSPMHYAHTYGGVSAIRCLNQSVDEPPDSPALAPRVGVF